MNFKVILYFYLVFSFISCSSINYKGSGVATTRDIYIQKNDDKNISLIINNFVDEVDKKELEKLIISDLNKVGYNVSTKKPFLSKQLHIDVLELKSIITTQNSSFSFLNFWMVLFKVVVSTNKYSSLTHAGFKANRKKDYREIPVYILISRIKIIEEPIEQETKIIAEDIQKDSVERTISKLEKKLSSHVSSLFKYKGKL